MLALGLSQAACSSTDPNPVGSTGGATSSQYGGNSSSSIAGGGSTSGGNTSAGGSSTGAGAAAGGAANTAGSTGVIVPSKPAAYPFPQNVKSQYCVYPANYDNARVRAAYQAWYDATVTADGAGGFLRVKKPDSGSVIGSTVSEGIG